VVFLRGMPDANYRFFPGQHGEVGGGWAEHYLSDVCLDWTYGKYMAAGPNVLLANPNTLSADLFDISDAARADRTNNRNNYNDFEALPSSPHTHRKNS
jgi:hypothetical protein